MDNIFYSNTPLTEKYVEGKFWSSSVFFQRKGSKIFGG